MALESYRSEKRRLGRVEAGVAESSAEKAADLSLKKILADKEMSRLFGVMAQKINPNANRELMRRYVRGELVAADIAPLEELRVTFIEKMRSADSFKRELNPKFIEDVIELHPQLGEIVASLGDKDFLAMLQKQSKEIVITDEAQFGEIKQGIDTIKAFKGGAFVEIGRSVDTICKEEGVKSSEEYQKILAVEDEKKRNDALKAMVKKDWPPGDWAALKRLVNHIPFIGEKLSGVSGKVKRLSAKKAELDEAYVQLDTYKANLGNILYMSLTGNDNLKKALAREVTGVKGSYSPELNMTDASKHKSLKVDDWEIKKAWKDFIWQFGDDVFINLDEAVQDEERETFLREFKEKKDAEASRRGFWAQVFQIDFDEKIDAYDRSKLRSDGR